MIYFLLSREFFNSNNINAEEEKVIDNNSINLNNLNNFNHDSEKNEFSNYK